MKPVAWMFKGLTGTYFGQADKLDRPDCVDLFTADQLRQAKVEVLRETATWFADNWTHDDPVVYRLRIMADEIENGERE